MTKLEERKQSITLNHKDSVSLITKAWIRLCAACVCSGVPDIIITVSTAPGLGSVMVTFASEIWNSVGYVRSVNAIQQSMFLPKS